MAQNSKRKKKNRVRQKDWTQDTESNFSHDLRKHRRTDTILTPTTSEIELPKDFEPNATVISHSKKWAFVQRDGEEEVQTCRIHELLGDRRSTIVAAGDRVLIEDADGKPILVGVGERRSKLSRLAIEHSHVDEQIFAANIDYLVIVVAADFLVERHHSAHFWDAIAGWGAFFGFISCTVIIFVSKFIGHKGGIMKDEDYYD